MTKHISIKWQKSPNKSIPYQSDNMTLLPMWLERPNIPITKHNFVHTNRFILIKFPHYPIPNVKLPMTEQVLQNLQTNNQLLDLW